MKKIALHLIWVLSLLFLSCADDSHPSAPSKENRILIYATNDMHATIEPFAKVVPYMESVRESGENVLLLNGGDMFTGNPYVDFYSTPGMPMIQMMNEAGYNLSTLGNHEFDYGQAALQECMDQADFNFICANIKVLPNSELKEQFEPYQFFEMDGIKVCVLGLLETEGNHDGKPIPSSHPDHLKGLEFSKPIETALNYKHLRKECDLFLALSHQGASEDSILAVKMPELDVIVGGHTHTKIEGTKIINGVLVTQAGSKLKYLGKTTVCMKDKKVTDKSFELVEIAPMQEDPEVRQEIEEIYDSPAFTQKVGFSEDEFPTRRSVSFMMADVMRAYFKADFTFQNIGGVRCDNFPKGDITMADLYRISPFNNDLMTIQMTPADIRSLLIHSSTDLKDEVDLSPSGLKYKLTYAGEKIKEVELTYDDGTPLDEKKVYTVIVNSYVGTYTKELSSLPTKTGKTEIEMLVEYLGKNNLQRSPIEDRWVVVK